MKKISLLLVIIVFLFNACTQQKAAEKPENFIEQEPAQKVLREFIVMVDDYGFYPDTIKAKIGDIVKINFKFRDNSIYYGGMDIKGPFPDIRYKLKGEQPLTAEFVMKEKTRITSYWPATGVKKGMLVVEVE